MGGQALGDWKGPVTCTGVVDAPAPAALVAPTYELRAASTSAMPLMRVVWRLAFLLQSCERWPAQPMAYSVSVTR